MRLRGEFDLESFCGRLGSDAMSQPPSTPSCRFLRVLMPSDCHSQKPHLLLGVLAVDSGAHMILAPVGRRLFGACLDIAIFFFLLMFFATAVGFHTKKIIKGPTGHATL